MHIFSQGEWFYASWLFSGQKRSAKQNHPLRKPGRKLHLFNTVRGLSLPAQWPWPSPCPGLSPVLAARAWLGASDKGDQLPLRAFESREQKQHHLWDTFSKEKRHLHWRAALLFFKELYRLKRGFSVSWWQWRFFCLYFPLNQGTRDLVPVVEVHK